MYIIDRGAGAGGVGTKIYICDWFFFRSFHTWTFLHKLLQDKNTFEILKSKY